MDLETAKEWITKYQHRRVKTKKELREAGVAYLIYGEVMKTSEIYEQELREAIPVERVLEAAVSNREQGFLKASLNCYRLAADNLNIEDRDIVSRIFEGLRNLKEWNGEEIKRLEDRLLDKFRSSNMEQKIRINENEAYELIKENHSGKVLTKEEIINLGDAYILFGEIKRAVEIYKSIDEEISSSKIAEGARHRRNKGKIQEALDMYEEAIRRFDIKKREEILEVKRDLRKLREELTQQGFENLSNVDKVENYLRQKVLSKL
jgi:tetratricopeptide (TPR) repeat protein